MPSRPNDRRLLPLREFVDWKGDGCLLENPFNRRRPAIREEDSSRLVVRRLPLADADGQ